MDGNSIARYNNKKGYNKTWANKVTTINGRRN